MSPTFVMSLSHSVWCTNPVLTGWACVRPSFGSQTHARHSQAACMPHARECKHAREWYCVCMYM